jgi:Flp pilus assembly protein TadG
MKAQTDMSRNRLNHCLSRRVANALRRFGRGQGEGIGGVAAIEFALFAPILMVLFLCTVDLGLGFYRKMQVQNASQAGAQYAVLNGYKSSGITAAVTNATKFTDIAATPAPSQSCGCPSTTGIVAATCGSLCTSGSQAGTYVVVSAQATYTTLFPYPIIPNSFPFAVQSTVRIK